LFGIGQLKNRHLREEVVVNRRIAFRHVSDAVSISEFIVLDY